MEPLRDRKIIVTGGPTREWLDTVRFLSNPSSGKMGVAIADEASAKAREIVFIHGAMDKALLANKSYRMIDIDTTVDLLNAVLSEIRDNSVLIMAAAPADFTPINKSKTKIKKENEELVIKLKKNPDILKTVAKIRAEGGIDNLFIVGFAAETEDMEFYALQKLREKNLDMICLNDVSRCDAGFGTDTNVITIFTRNRERIELPLLSK
ncbi:MAG: phosphopantothenoylcysteine decarboxylase, partial [Spirochaetota bacterium]|nr:phosphopantothenoylcysteine decarboxylase [Spirochaetota bacterium]